MPGTSSLFVGTSWTQVKQLKNNIRYCRHYGLNSVGADSFIHSHMPLWLGWILSHTSYLIFGPLLTALSFMQAFYLFLYDWLLVSVQLLLISCQWLPATQRENKLVEACHLGDCLISFQFYLISKERPFLWNHCSNSCSFAHKVVYSVSGQLRSFCPSLVSLRACYHETLW